MSTTMTIEGNLTKDPEARYTPAGKPVVKFGVADNRSWTKDGQAHEQTHFFDVEVWGTLAENVVTSLHKGDRVLATGHLKQATWEADDGTRRSKVTLVASSIGPCLRWASVEGITRNGGGSAPAPEEDEPF